MCSGDVAPSRLRIFPSSRFSKILSILLILSFSLLTLFDDFGGGDDILPKFFFFLNLTALSGGVIYDSEDWKDFVFCQETCFWISEFRLCDCDVILSFFFVKKGGCVCTVWCLESLITSSKYKATTNTTTNTGIFHIQQHHTHTPKKKNQHYLGLSEPSILYLGKYNLILNVNSDSFLL